MEAIAYFNTEYFLLELQNAGVIKNDHSNVSQLLTLEKVPNITIGLVLAAKSLEKFENQIILNWIRKGRKVTTLIEEQFALYDKLSLYLQSNFHTKEDIHEWKQILDETKYIFPEKEHRGWLQIFGNTPNLLKKVDPDNISNRNIIQLPKKLIERENEKIKQNETQKENTDDEYCKLKQDNSNVFFTHKYFLSLLNEVGAIASNVIEKDIPIYLAKVPNITIGLVLAAKAINFFTDEKILTWIRKGRKLTPLIEKQFLLYEKLSDYLMNYIDIKDIDRWKSLLDFRYVFPASDKEGWSLMFGEIPELCHKIDGAQKSFKQSEVQKTTKKVETSRTETDGSNESCKQIESSKIEFDEAQKSFKQFETSKTEIDEAKKCNPLETPKTEETVEKFNAHSDETTCLIYNSAFSIDEIAVDETKEDEHETRKEIKLAAHTRGENDEKIYDKVNVEITENEIIEEKDKNEALSKLKQAVLKENDSDQNRSIDKSNQSGNKISLSDNDYSSDQIKYAEKTDTEYSNLSGNKISSSELGKAKMSQSENDDSSDWDDELEDLFNAVGVELTAAENEEKSQLESDNKKDEENHEYLSGFAIQSEVDTDNENNMNTIDTLSTYMKHSENYIEHKSERVHGGFTRDYFFSVIKKAGMLTDVKEHRELTSHAKISAGLLCSIKALDLFTNQEIFLWIKKCCKITRGISYHDHIKLASYRELANYLMNEVDIKDEEEWKIFLNSNNFLDYTENIENDTITHLQNAAWKIGFGNRKYVPPICDTVKIKFNHKYYFAQLLGYDAIKWEIKDGILQSYLVKMVKPQQLTVGLVLAAKAVGMFSNRVIVTWICMCQNLTSFDTEKVQKQFTIYKEFSNYLEKEADERDYEHVKCILFTTLYKPWLEDTEMPSDWNECFNQNIKLHKRFSNFKCCYDDLLSSKKLGSLEVLDSVCHEPYEVCKVWNDICAGDWDQLLGNCPNNNPFHSNYFKNLLISKKVTEELIKVEKITVGLMMAAIHENFEKQNIANWVKECHGTKPSKRQFFMYEVLCDHLLALKCNIEASYWKQLIDSVGYQVPVENSDIWSNIFGSQIPNVLGITLDGNFEFERMYQHLIYDKSEYEFEHLECIKFRHDLRSHPCGTIDEKQNFFFDKEYFASLLTNYGAISVSSRILKSTENLTIGQVMAVIIDNTLNDEDIHEWIVQSEKDPCIKKTLETLDLKSQFFAYKLIASHLMNYQSENHNDSYLKSWTKILSTPYGFSHIGMGPLENFVSLQINSIYLSSEWFISKKCELKTVIPVIRKVIQNQSFEEINNIIMLSNQKPMPIFKIMNRKKIFGIGKSFFKKLLSKDKFLDKANLLRNPTKKKIKIVHVVGALALGIFRDSDIRNWIKRIKGFNGVIPFGPLKRLAHYILCEVPSELAMEWVEILTKRDIIHIVDSWKAKQKRVRIVSLFGKSPNRITRYLSLIIDAHKHPTCYIPNECKNFLRAQCNNDCCKLHICNRMKFCIAFPKSGDIKATKNESESLITSKDETTSGYQKVKNVKTARIPGLCIKFNENGNCLNNFRCRWLHQCDRCLGDHPGWKCAFMRLGKEKDRCKRKTSRSPSPVHRESKIRKSRSPSVHDRSNYLPVKDESPSWQHQLPSLPPPPPTAASYSYPHVSQSAHQFKMLNTTHSHQNISLTLSMNQSIFSGVMENKLSMNQSIWSRVIEKVAKLTFNKDTSCIIQHIKREVDNFGIPATMDNIGKIVLEVSEIHKAEAMRGNISDNYGHLSSSNPQNEASMSVGYGQPNWNQTPSQQSTGYMYQSSLGVPSFQSHTNEGSMPLDSYGYNSPSNRINFSRKQMRANQYKKLYSKDPSNNPKPPHNQLSRKQMRLEQYKRKLYLKDPSNNPKPPQNQLSRKQMRLEQYKRRMYSKDSSLNSKHYHHRIKFKKKSSK